MSNRFGYPLNGSTESGFSHELHIGKTSGRFNFNLSQERTDTKFSSDDMGYFTNNNFLIIICGLATIGMNQGTGITGST